MRALHSPLLDFNQSLPRSVTGIVAPQTAPGLSAVAPRVRLCVPTVPATLPVVTRHNNGQLLFNSLNSYSGYPDAAQVPHS